jgi:hypothetical protein
MVGLNQTVEVKRQAQRKPSRRNGRPKENHLGKTAGPKETVEAKG